MEDSVNDPPLHLREAVPDTKVGNESDEEDPLSSNLYALDIEFNNGLETPLKWIIGNCHSEHLPVVGTVPFNPPYTPGCAIPNLRNLSCAEVIVTVGITA